MLGVVVKNIAISAGGLTFDSRVGQIRHSVAADATFFRSCVAQAQNRGDEPRHSLHTSAYYREYIEDFFVFLLFRLRIFDTSLQFPYVDQPVHDKKEELGDRYKILS